MWDELIIRILPIKIYRKISYDIADIFSTTIDEYPPAKKFFNQMSIPQLRDFSQKHANKAKKYDPHESINNVLDFFNGIYKLIETIILLMFFIGLLANVGLIIGYSRNALNLIGFIGQLPMIVVLGGSTTITLIFLSLILYTKLITLNTFATKILTEELTIEGAKMKTRDKDELIGYGMWNYSLNGGAAFKILVIFLILWVSSVLTPRHDPYHYVNETIKESVDVITNADGVIDAVIEVYEQKK